MGYIIIIILIIAGVASLFQVSFGAAIGIIIAMILGVVVLIHAGIAYSNSSRDAQRTTNRVVLIILACVLVLVLLTTGMTSGAFDFASAHLLSGVDYLAHMFGRFDRASFSWLVFGLVVGTSTHLIVVGAKCWSSKHLRRFGIGVLFGGFLVSFLPGLLAMKLRNAEAPKEFAATLQPAEPESAPAPHDNNVEPRAPQPADGNPVPKSPSQTQPPVQPGVVQRDHQAVDLTSSATASASSTLPGTRKYSYVPRHLLDGDLTTSWQTKVRGSGRGIWFSLRFQKEIEVSEIRVANGFQSMQTEFGDLYAKNSRIHCADIVLGRRRQSTCFGSNERGYVAIAVSPPASARTIKFEVTSVHVGSEWNDLAVSDVRVWGRWADEEVTTKPTSPRERSGNPSADAPKPRAPSGTEAAKGHFNRGYKAYVSKDYNTARRHFQAALKADPAYEKARTYLLKISE